MKYCDKNLQPPLCLSTHVIEGIHKMFQLKTRLLENDNDRPSLYTVTDE